MANSLDKRDVFRVYICYMQANVKCTAWTENLFIWKKSVHRSRSFIHESLFFLSVKTCSISCGIKLMSGEFIISDVNGFFPTPSAYFPCKVSENLFSGVVFFWLWVQALIWTLLWLDLCYRLLFEVEKKRCLFILIQNFHASIHNIFGMTWSKLLLLNH